MLKVFDCFAGYGGAEFALKKAGIEHECIGFSEIDKYAIQCFLQNHDIQEKQELGKRDRTEPIRNFGNITKIDWKTIPDFDLITGGFPCQDISNAGKQDLSKGRSILGLELAKALREKQPKYFLFENVAAIQQEKFRPFLREMENQFKNAGYQVFRKCLNTKNFGVPQNRERVWFVGYRNDLRKDFGFSPFPQETGCTLRLKDILEPEVDKKYFLKPEQAEKLLASLRHSSDLQNEKLCYTLDATNHKHPKCVELTLIDSFNKRVQNNEVSTTLKSTGEGKEGSYLLAYSSSGRGDHIEERIKLGEANTLTTGKENNKSCNYVLTSVQTDSMIYLGKTKETTHQSNYNLYDSNGLSPTLNCVQNTACQPRIKNNSSIRRLTPKECFRLMGFQKDEINLAGLSDTQCYKLAGNGWDINVVSLIFKNMKMN